MDSYASNTTWPEVARRVRDAGRIAVVTHERPDGDALGSALALARALPRLGKTVDVLLTGPLEPALEGLIGETPVRRVEAEGSGAEAAGGEPDLIVVVDTGAWTQLGPLAEWVRGRRARTVVIDHHPHGDDVGAWRMVETSAAATAEMILDLLDELGCAPARGVAEALFLGIATDCGWFRYSSTTSRTMRAAARLLEAGVDRSGLYARLEETFRPERLALEARALASLEYAADGAVAIQTLARRDFEETGGTISDLTGIVNAPLRVAGVKVAGLIAETAPGTAKVSLRAKEAPAGDERLARLCDVGRVARELGGGGHRAAAGVRLGVGPKEARRVLLEALAASPAARTGAKSS